MFIILSVTNESVKYGNDKYFPFRGYIIEIYEYKFLMTFASEINWRAYYKVHSYTWIYKWNNHLHVLLFVA